MAIKTSPTAKGEKPPRKPKPQKPQTIRKGGKNIMAQGGDGSI